MESRINALLRRANDFGAADTELVSNNIRICLLKGQAFKNGSFVDLTAAEYRLLCLFMQNPNVVLPRERILEKLWDCEGSFIDSGSLTVYMRRLRMKVEDRSGRTPDAFNRPGYGLQMERNGVNFYESI